MAKKSIHIHVHHITRVEGHGDIAVDIENGQARRIEWRVPESPRFFEAMVVGRDCNELAPITSRICGICSIGHTFASLKATEAAFGIQITEQTRRLRQILNYGENLQSHTLHVGYLAVPDFLKVGSVVPLVASHKEAVLLVVRLHRLANEICDLVGGRTTHPIRTMINGFTMVPKPKELEALKQKLTGALGDIQALADLVKALAGALPVFDRETEYISLTDPREYALYDGMIKSTDATQPIPVADYLKVTNEYIVNQSTAKWCRFHRDAYFAGALARYNNNHTQLDGFAQKIACGLGLNGPCHNPYFNTVCQVVEIANSTCETIKHIDWLLDHGLRTEDTRFTPREGQGVGAVDVPRGILFHDYTYDRHGKCVKANCIIPTNQNHANIQKDFEKLVPQYQHEGQEALQFKLEMLVRAYDPCISCSTH